MKAVINLKVEIIEGPDKGYVLEEQNRLIDLEFDSDNLFYTGVKPYKLNIYFVTPDLLRRYRRDDHE